MFCKERSEFMPPKAKFTKEEMIESALDIVKTEGFQALTARALGTKLGTSSRPIFTLFQNMEELQQEVIKAATALYNQRIQDALTHSSQHYFESVGQQYILFSITEPKLFQLLFMKEQAHLPDLSCVLPSIDENYESILASIQTEYDLNLSSSVKLYQHLWIYTHGIASLCATKMCYFSSQEITEMMADIFTSLLKKYKEEQN